jgi:hypothetical protein
MIIFQRRAANADKALASLAFQNLARDDAASNKQIRRTENPPVA